MTRHSVEANLGLREFSARKVGRVEPGLATLTAGRLAAPSEIVRDIDPFTVGVD